MRKKKEWRFAKEKPKVVEFKPVPKVPNLLEIEEAFKEAFPHELLRDVEFTMDSERVILTFHSDLPPTRMIKTRTYAQYPGQDMKEILKNLPSLDSNSL